MTLGQDRIARMRKQYEIDPSRRLGLIGVPLLRSKAADPKNPRDIVVTANTDEVDLEREIVVPKGGNLDEYKRRKANFIDHKYDFPHHVGFMRSIRLAPDGRSLVNRSQIFDNLKSPLADDLMVVARTIGIGSSIGYEEIDGSPPRDDDPAHYQKAGWITRKWSMIELSFTAMPCNTGCQGGAESDVDEEKCYEALDGLVTKSRIKRETAVAFGLPGKKVFAVAGSKSARETMVRVFDAPMAVFDA